MKRIFPIIIGLISLSLVGIIVIQVLWLKNMKGWEPLFADISKLNEFEPKVREFRRYFLNGATIVEPDSAGRLLIPPNLKEHAELQKDIVLVAAVNKIEIWDSKKYHQLFDSFSAEDFSSLARDVMAGGEKPGISKE